MITAHSSLFLPRKIGNKKPKSSAEYLDWNPHDGFKYEWQNGKLLKTDTMIQPEQQFIVDNLLDIFNQTPAYQAGGRLTVEVKSKTLKDSYRVPDLAYFSLAQRREMATGAAVKPALAIEIISKTDFIYDGLTKVEEYFNAGYAVVWWIIPPLETIYVFQLLSDIKVYRGTDVCDAQNIAAGFIFSAESIFIKP